MRKALLLVFFPGLALAGVATDGTLGAAGILRGPDYAITASLGRQVGTNLFQSFSFFDLAKGESAVFSGPAGIQNIIARVTGGAQSNIDGQISSTIPLANLFLVNPAGIVFGPDASLNIGGSFYASTANYLRLSDGGRFDATKPQNDILTTAPVSAFGFLGPAAPISAASLLSVSNGNTLGLVGGNIGLNGALLVANGGQVDLASLASAAEVGLTAAGLDTSQVTQFGNVSMSGGVIDVSEAANSTAGSGSVQIRGGQIVMSNAATITASTVSGWGTMIDIAATGDFTLDYSTIFSRTYGSGWAGDISVSARNLTLTTGAQISASSMTGATGTGGNIFITGRDTVSISGLDAGGYSSGIFAKSYDQGSSGTISLIAANLNIGQGGVITSSALGSGGAGGIGINATKSLYLAGGAIYSNNYGTGSGGGIVISAPSFTDDGGLVQAVTQGAGNGGWISINSTTASVVNGGRIDASAWSGSSGNGGTITINASDAISVSGTGSGGASSAVVASAQGSGNGGTITLIAKNISLDRRGVITSSSFDIGNAGSILFQASGAVDISGGSAIYSNTYAGGLGGNIMVIAPAIRLTNDAFVQVATYGSGDGGFIAFSGDDIAVSGGSRVDSSGTSGSSGKGGKIGFFAKNAITVGGYDSLGLQSAISAQANGAGSGGLIAIQAATLDLGSGGVITTSSSGGGTAGNSLIQASQSVNIDTGAIYSNAYSSGNGGSILISAPQITGSNYGLVQAKSTGSGNGGSILFTADAIALSSGARIDAGTTFLGNGGTISLLANHSLDLAGNSQITSMSTGFGTAGNISINAGDSFRIDNSTVTTGATLADGGNISLVARNLIYLNQSSISATVGNGLGNGGNIFLDPLLTVMNGSAITANAFGGNGGNINLFAANFLQSANSSITASSRLGVSGTVTMNGQLTDLSGGLASLPIVYLNSNGLLRARCATHMAGAGSSFVVAGRGGIPDEPDMPIAARLPAISGGRDLYAMATLAECMR